MKTLDTTEAVIQALGGTAKVGEMCGAKQTAVCNWRRRPNFPPETFLVLTDELKRRHLAAPLSLWKMAEPAASGKRRNPQRKATPESMVV